MDQQRATSYSSYTFFCAYGLDPVIHISFFFNCEEDVSQHSLELTVELQVKFGDSYVAV